MTRIYNEDKEQVVYIYSVGNEFASVELAHPDMSDVYSHVHLTIDEFEDFINKCNELLHSMKTSEKFSF